MCSRHSIHPAPTADAVYKLPDGGLKELESERGEDIGSKAADKGEGWCLWEVEVGESSDHVEKAEIGEPPDQAEKELSKHENQVVLGSPVVHDMKLEFVADPPYNRS